MRSLPSLSTIGDSRWSRRSLHDFKHGRLPETPEPSTVNDCPSSADLVVQAPCAPALLHVGLASACKHVKALANTYKHQDRGTMQGLAVMQRRSIVTNAVYKASTNQIFSSSLLFQDSIPAGRNSKYGSGRFDRGGLQLGVEHLPKLLHDWQG